MDKSQRMILNDEEQESVLATGTNMLKDINLVLKNKPIKLKENEDFFVDINEKQLNHREVLRKPEKYLKLNKKTTEEEYLSLIHI